MAWKPRLREKLVIDVRAAEGSAPELAKRFGLPPSTIWRIKHGIAGACVSYTPTVLLPEWRRGGTKLSTAQRAHIESIPREDRAAARERIATNFSITTSRVNEIWLELDFMAAHWAAVSKTDAEMVAGRVGQIEPHADVPLGDRH